MTRALFCLFALFALLTACAPKDDLAEVPVPIGDLYLGHAIVLADKAQLGPLSRTASPQEWSDALGGAVRARVGRYQGDRYFHLGINIDAYALALPGIPVVAKPKSILVASVTVWDDANQMKLNAEPKQFYVFENTTPETFISSGLTQTREQQMQNLSVNMARKIEDWLRENEDWFGGVASRNPPGARSALELPDDPANPAAPSSAPSSAPGAALTPPALTTPALTTPALTTPAPAATVPAGTISMQTLPPAGAVPAN